MIFIDCESAGLRGTIFAAAMVAEDGMVLFDGYYRHPALQENQWLRENVEPNLSGKEYPDRVSFLQAVYMAWNMAKHKYGNGDYMSLAAVAHMGSPVESNLFQELFLEKFIGEFDGPYPLLDTAPLLLKAGYAADSEEKYAAQVGIELPEGYKPHSALADAQLTRLVWNSLV